MDPRLKQGAIGAVQRYGTQFASSRAYLSVPPYRELEELLGRITGAPVLVMPTTTLGHLAAIPTLIQEDDAVLLDQQVHHSVQMAVEHVRLLGARVEVVKHNDMEALEPRLEALTEHCGTEAPRIHAGEEVPPSFPVLNSTQRRREKTCCIGSARRC